MSEGVPHIQAEELVRLLKGKGKPLVLDVRSIDEFNADHIRGAVNLPIQELQSRAPAELKKYAGKPIVCVCEHGERSSISAAMLAWMGFRAVMNLYGGMSEWRLEGRKTVK